jgi:hypothetical protein
MRRVLPLVAMILVVAGCAAAPGPASPRRSPGAETSIEPSAVPTTERSDAAGSPASESPDAAPVTTPPTGAPSDAPATDAPATDPPASDAPSDRPDPATFLQVCRLSVAVDADSIPCADAVETALRAPGLAGAHVTRVDVRAACERGACGGSRAGSLAVTVLSERPPTEVDVVRGTDGGLTVDTVHPGTPPATPPFTAPATGLAALPGAPPVLAGRTAYPLCGEETAAMGGPYDLPARRCFLDGVLAGAPVEFASRTTGTEGGALTTLVRFAGSGGIEYITGEGGLWTRAFTGIRPANGGLVFDIDGMATRREEVR